MSGVEIREKSLRLTFTFEGKQHHKTLMVNSEPMKPTAPNIKHATRLVDEIRDRIRHGTFSMAEYFPASGTGGGATVATQLDTWLGTLRIEDSTRKAYQSAAKFWKLTIGTKALRGLKSSDIKTAVATRPNLSGKTVNNYVSVLREAIQLAVDDKLLPDNPVVHVPRASHQKEPPDPFSADECERILAHMRAAYPAQVVQYTEAKFFTGLRTSEAFGLCWDNVDLSSKSIEVKEGIVRSKEVKSTKTHSARTVFLNSRGLAAIRAQKASTFLAGVHVFHDPKTGKRWGR